MIDSSKVRSQFPSLARVHNNIPLTYLDAPAGTQVPQQVIDSIANYYKTSNANTHGEFLTTNETDAVITKMRTAMANMLGAEGPETISIGQNMTTLNFALARGIARNLRPGDEVLITQLDHEGNRGPWLMLREFGVNVREVKLSPNGTLDENDFAEKVNEKTRLIAVGLASNALGTVNNVQLARELAYKAGAWLMLDAVAYAPHFKINVQELGCDFLLCSAYKFYGPHVGILYSRPGLLDRVKTDRLRTALQYAPEKIETGTLNHAAIAGVTAAAEFVMSLGYEDIGAHERKLAVRLYDGLCKLKQVKVIGQDFASEHRAPTVSFTFEGKTPTQVCKHLAQQNIFAWDGHFYAQRAIEVLGLYERGGVTRIGMAVYNTPEEIDKTLDVIKSFK
ncbi:MAG TPA: cysteine desulfurase-like protein [Cyclobacteriaceae bacterium]|nr:cysteine desulfurase-like protein [Cyclobacteriaceae bacterium]